MRKAKRLAVRGRIADKYEYIDETPLVASRKGLDSGLWGSLRLFTSSCLGLKTVR